MECLRLKGIVARPMESVYCAPLQPLERNSAYFPPVLSSRANSWLKVRLARAIGSNVG